ncbi:hypothetical protein GCM10010211_15060 [Streptomyces albospinus]|uniref:Uncharacterized protein n=1 Tax=Streptomyces albospinus TaxID=285515 RepID=A0ABQ2UUC5_9ACTN|nr:hypothetical protein GCM10010211_15060 [Streptomyces albospinus]
MGAQLVARHAGGTVTRRVCGPVRAAAWCLPGGLSDLAEHRWTAWSWGCREPLGGGRDDDGDRAAVGGTPVRVRWPGMPPPWPHIRPPHLSDGSPALVGTALCR